MPPRGEKRGETGEKRGETGDPQLPASTADETATTGKDGSTGFDLALESNEALAAMDDTGDVAARIALAASWLGDESGDESAASTGKILRLVLNRTP